MHRLKKSEKIILIVTVFFVIVTSLVFTLYMYGIFSPQIENVYYVSDYPPTHYPPNLVVTLTAGSYMRGVMAVGLTFTWSGIEADAHHPLLLDDYSSITCVLYEPLGTVELLYSYQPDTIIVTRWPAELIGIKGEYDGETSFELSSNRFQIVNDGNNYVYGIHALWRYGDAYYAFRIDSSAEKDPLSQI
jgi:hypothetical protein